MTSTLSGLVSLLDGKQVQVEDQVDGPQEGTVLTVDEGSFTACVLMNNSVFGTDRKFGPLPYSRTAEHPQVGDKALVCFVGKGIDRGWLIAYGPA